MAAKDYFPLCLCLSLCLCYCDNDTTTFKCFEPASVKSLVQLMHIICIVGLRYKQTSCAIVVRIMQDIWLILPSSRCDDALALPQQGLNVRPANKSLLPNAHYAFSSPLNAICKPISRITHGFVQQRKTWDEATHLFVYLFASHFQ